MTDRDRAAKIAALNDKFRRNLHDRSLGKTFVTDGVASLGHDVVARIFAAVIAFADDQFTEDNDPWSEHEFGSFEIDGEKLFWKIDYYDRRDSDLGAEDPTDPATTERVLTIMLASEY